MEINRRKLDQIAEEVVAAFKQGTDPSKAIKEVSKLYDFNIEQVRRLCETANVKIKQMLIESGDLNPTFPLADWEEIMVDVETNDVIETKVASALFLDNFEGDEDLFNEVTCGDIEKVASSPGISAKAVAGLLIDMDAADNRLKSKRNEFSHILEKAASEIFDHLHQEEMSRGNFDLSYTVAKKSTFSFDGGAVDGLFKMARETFERNFEQPVKKPEIIKIAGSINHESRFCDDIRIYVKTRTEILKIATAEAKIDKARRELIKTFGGLLSGTS